MRILAFLIIVVLGLMAYVRLAPTSARAWHKPTDPKAPGDYPFEGGFEVVRQLNAPADQVLANIERIALATPRTTLFAGSVAEGMITFQTRSRVMGFPDYTTVAVNGDTLQINGRLRFGRSDLGVNQARIQGWLAQLGDVIEAS